MGNDKLRSHIEWLRGDHENCNPWLADSIEALLRPAPPAEAIEHLAGYQQADEDGVMVLVSRQAIEECLTYLRAARGV